MAHNDYQSVDVVLVGAGIMSATLGVLLKELNPGITLEVVELRESGAVESSNPWNNAGTGHAALCELNYTPEGADGSIDIKKSVNINAQFEESKQFWAYLIEKGAINSPKTFINPVPHMSFVRGESGIAFLKKRFEALRQHHAFTEMEYTEDRGTIAEWAPLLIPGRDASEPLAMTRVQAGTDVNFGAVTEQMLAYLTTQPDAKVTCNQKVTDLKRDGEGWLVDIKDTRSGATRKIKSKFVFLGAGGGALPLLQLSG
ncbi:MAG: malate:quinone oxidoreductase, partial [Pseudomonas sp.]|nr:malate:quinone oxidoreductase [Pseudomonas sp.]